MALQLQLENGSLLGGGGLVFRAANVHLKPIDHGALGHYRAAVKVLLSPAQAANSRLFTLRNTGTNLIIPTFLEATVLPIGGIANPYVLDLSLFKCVNFTATDGVNATAALVSVMRTSGMSSPPGGAQVYSLAAAGSASGMTGGTLTKSSLPLSTLQAWMATVSTTSQPVAKQFIRPTTFEYPMVCAQNEGFELENSVLGSATANAIQVVIEVAWAETTAY